MKDRKLSNMERALLSRLYIIEHGQNGVSIDEFVEEFNIDYDYLMYSIEGIIVDGLVQVNSNEETILLTKKGMDFLRKNQDLVEDRYSFLIHKALRAKSKIVDGFIDLAESVYEIHDKKLYLEEFDNFKDFCEEKLGFSPKTIYIYLQILNLIIEFPEFIDKSKAIRFGQKKMRLISQALNRADREIRDVDENQKIKAKILTDIKPQMKSSEVEKKLEEILPK